MGFKCVKVYAKVLEKGTEKGIPHAVVRYYDEWDNLMEYRITDEQGNTEAMLMPPNKIYYVKVHQVPTGYTCHQCTMERQTTGDCDSAPVTHYFYLKPPSLFSEQTIFIAAIAFFAIMLIIYLWRTE